MPLRSVDRHNKKKSEQEKEERGMCSCIEQDNPCYISPSAYRVHSCDHRNRVALRVFVVLLAWTGLDFS